MPSDKRTRFPSKEEQQTFFIGCLLSPAAAGRLIIFVRSWRKKAILFACCLLFVFFFSPIKKKIARYNQQSSTKITTSEAPTIQACADVPTTVTNYGTKTATSNRHWGPCEDILQWYILLPPTTIIGMHDHAWYHDIIVVPSLFIIIPPSPLYLQWLLISYSIEYRRIDMIWNCYSNHLQIYH